MFMNCLYFHQLTKMFLSYFEFVFIRHQDPLSSPFIFYLAAIAALDLLPIWTNVLKHFII